MRTELGIPPREVSGARNEGQWEHMRMPPLPGKGLLRDSSIRFLELSLNWLIGYLWIGSHNIQREKKIP